MKLPLAKLALAIMGDIIQRRVYPRDKESRDIVYSAAGDRYVISYTERPDPKPKVSNGLVPYPHPHLVVLWTAWPKPDMDISVGAPLAVGSYCSKIEALAAKRAIRMRLEESDNWQSVLYSYWNVYRHRPESLETRSEG